MEIVRYTYKQLYSVFNHPALRRIGRWILPFRVWIIVCVHAGLFIMSYLYSFFVFNNGVLDGDAKELLALTIVPLTLIRMAVFAYHDLYQGLWRYVSFEDLLNIIRASIISTLIFSVFGIIWEPLRIPDTLYILDFTSCVFFVGGIRFIVRNIRENFVQQRPVKDYKRVVLIGPMDKVQPMVKEFVSSPKSHYRPVAIVDPEKEDHLYPVRLNDIPVYTFQEIKDRQGRFGTLKAMVFCWPNATRKKMDAVIEDLKEFQVPFKTLSPVEDILSGKVSINDIREVEIDDLLERPPVQIEMDRIRAYLNDKIILVTGAGGSIGSELCRQITYFKPKLLVLIERSENSLYDLKLEFRKKFPQVPLKAIISSINDYPGLSILLKKLNVDVVFHAAAYKHVPLMEEAPVESSYNNIIGTHNIVKASLESGVKRFVMVSTDKAVNPSNIMGATKRVAEMVVQSYNHSNRTRFMTVRFGNVLGSAGSVIPIFKKQIQDGGPITVTHQDVERFFMTIPESVQLILQAGCMGRGGEIFVLDMGQPIKILELAKKLIMLSGKRPYEDIDIEFIGMRPGEKMYEELFNTGEVYIDTTHTQIKVARSEDVERGFVESQVEEIQTLISRHDDEGLCSKFKEIVPGYTCVSKERQRA